VNPAPFSLPIQTYPGRLVSRIPLPYWRSLTILWELVFLTDYLYSLTIPGGHAHILVFGVGVLFFASVCINVEYCARVLSGLYTDLTLFIDHDPQELRDWYEKKLRTGYQGVWPLFAGILLAVVEELTIGTIVRSFTPNDSFLQALRSGYRIAGFFFLGMSLWALVQVITIPMQLIRFKVRVSLNQVSGHGLQALGAGFFKMSMAITFCFVLVVATAWLAGLGDNVFILVWEGVGVATIFCFFLLPQVGLHRIMASEKEQRLLSFSHHLESALEKSLKDPSSDNMQRLKELFELQQHLRSLNEWPFDVNTLWQLITALLIPLLLAALEIIF
jgi:hypothetical protein